MKKLSEKEDIWVEKMQTEDLKIAIEYATKSLPWTFDRMGYGGNSQAGVNRRIMNILKGVLNQNILERVLRKKGYKCKKDWSTYRESDIFDFSIEDKIYDIKTTHVYSEYNDVYNREPLSVDFIVENRCYPGPKWKKFLPVDVPLTQITYEKTKDSYIFGIAETRKDINKIQPQPGDNGFWVAVPYGKSFIFFQNTKLIKAREEECAGFQIKIFWKRTQQSILNEKREGVFTLFGEWDGKRQTEKIKIGQNEVAISEKEFSSLSCIKFDHPSILNAYDEIFIEVENNFSEFIPKTTNPNINLNDENFSWKIVKGSFINLNIPNDYKVFWLGHIPVKEFVECMQNYKSYFSPHPQNMEENVEGILTTKMRYKLQALDNRKKRVEERGQKVVWPYFLPLIKHNKPRFGLLIAAQRFGRTLGAATYIYPPYALRESALYILPKDLYVMEDL